MSNRFIEDWRWCPALDGIAPWDEETGICFACTSEGHATVEGHLTLVCARYAEAAWADNDRLRRYLGAMRTAELGEPEALAADMLRHYHAAAKEREYPEQLTRLIEGLARVTVIAMGNSKWARIEQGTAAQLAGFLRTAVDRCWCLKLDVELCLDCRAAIALHKEWAWGPAHEELAELDKGPYTHAMEDVGHPPASVAP